MTLRLNGDNSGFTEIKAADTAGDNSIKLPASNGSANQFLQNGGTAGELQYTNAGGGLHYDSSGRLLVGASSARANFFNTASSAPQQFQVEGTTGNTCSVASISSTADTSGGRLLLAHQRSGAVGGNTIVNSGDQAGYITFQGNDGGQFAECASIEAIIDGAPSNDVMPGKLVFNTNSGSASPTPRMEIGSNGALKLLAGCPGIDFSAIQTNSAGMSSEMLDSYEEGTWTPSIGGNTTYNIQQGTYVRVGRLVMINYYISIDNHGTGSARTVSGLPFTAAATTGGGAVAYFVNLQQNISYLSGYIYNGTTINFYGNATPDNNLSSSVSVFRGGAAVQGSNVYMAA